MHILKTAETFGRKRRNTSGKEWPEDKEFASTHASTDGLLMCRFALMMCADSVAFSVLSNGGRLSETFAILYHRALSS